MHHASKPGVGINDLQDLRGRASIVDRNGEIARNRELAERVQARDLDVVWRSARLLEIEADFADGHDPVVVGQLVKDIDGGRRCVGRVMTHARPYLAVTSRERYSPQDPRSVDPHTYHSRAPRLHPPAPDLQVDPHHL